jgi:hypothetical protein
MDIGEIIITTALQNFSGDSICVYYFLSIRLFRMQKSFSGQYENLKCRVEVGAHRFYF